MKPFTITIDPKKVTNFIVLPLIVFFVIGGFYFYRGNKQKKDFMNAQGLIQSAPLGVPPVPAVTPQAPAEASLPPGTTSLPTGVAQHSIGAVPMTRPAASPKATPASVPVTGVGSTLNGQGQSQTSH